MNIHIGMWAPNTKFHLLTLNEKITVIENEFKRARELALQGSNDKNSTFIFLCPEFTFKNISDSQTYAYNKNDIEMLNKRFSKLADSYPDSIIIPGTILFKTKTHATDEEKKKKYKERFFDKGVTNSELTIDDHNDLLTAIMDEKPLTQNAAYIFSAHQKHRGYKKQIPFNDVINKNISTFMPGHKNGVMIIKGIPIGIEICADHDAASLKRKQTSPVSIHLVLSNTIALNEKDIAYGATIAVNCAGDFINNKEARDNTCVSKLASNGQWQTLKPARLNRTLIYRNIPVTNTPTPFIRSRL